jgi:hypothetical protein
MPGGSKAEDRIIDDTRSIDLLAAPVVRAHVRVPVAPTGQS